MISGKIEKECNYCQMILRISVCDFFPVKAHRFNECKKQQIIISRNRVHTLGKRVYVLD